MAEPTFTFDEINKLVIVDLDYTEVTCQQIVNAVRDWEDELNNLDIPVFMFPSGKEDLGGGTYVGITVVFVEWKLKFTDRPGPEWIICQITGGNFVGVDENGDEQVPIEPSSYVTVVRTSSSSATLQELSTLQYSSFDGGVWIDVINGVTGTKFPRGTPQLPVNNLDDAQAIATERGFNTLFIIGDIEFNNGDNLDNYIIVGQNTLSSLITVIAPVTTDNTEFRNLAIQGELDGLVQIEECFIVDLLYVEGDIKYSVIFGEIDLAGTQSTNLFNCWSGVPGAQTPVIDMGGSGRNLGVRAYSGGLTIKNFTGAINRISLDFVSGQAILDPTCTAGLIVVRGTAKLLNNSQGSDVDDSNLVNPFTISDQVWDEQESEHTISGSFGAILGGLDVTVAGIDTRLISVETTVNEIHTMVSGMEVTVSGMDEALALLETLKDNFWNKKVLTKINDNQYKEELYDDAGSVVIRTHTLTKAGDVETRQ